ncbi:hypothetical protein DFJ73DRAFT_800687 [Zopfochytrium polystomum]|nr:hypothetical protein DFJ73DRAFT_800687 [Zopfochytrium polystomum]
MVQKKVGTTGVKDGLRTQKANPEARSKYLLNHEDARDHPNKVKLSDAIYGQIAKQQKDVGYVHSDMNPGNIRVHASPSDKPGVVPKMELIDWGMGSATVAGAKGRGIVAPAAASSKKAVTPKTNEASGRKPALVIGSTFDRGSLGLAKVTA